MPGVLQRLQARIKYSRLYKTERVERLYIPYGVCSLNVKTSAWLEVVNDQLQVFVRVEDVRSRDLYDDALAARYKGELERQLHEIIHSCELERKKTPLHERLKDNALPVYADSALRHQAEALRFCCSMKVSALYADTGTGKSRIAIDLAVSRYEAGEIKKALVFLPAATMKNFQKQVELWCTRKEIVWKFASSESMSASMKAIFDALCFADAETQVVVDESHFIKNPTAKRSQRIAMVCNRATYKLVMTGTPVTDNIHDLYMQYACLSPLIIGVDSWRKFEEKYLIIGGRLNEEIIGYKNVDHLMGLVEPYTYQIAKEECLTLPAKTFLTHTCELTGEQQERYDDEKELLLEVIKKKDLRATDIFKSLTRMQQICSGFTCNEAGKTCLLASNKLALFGDIPAEDKLAVFCKYIFEVEAVVKRFGREKCAIFTGRNPKERDDELADFVKGAKPYFVATMQSGGTGLNGLQEVCRRIVFFSNSFSYFHRKQSIGRVDRQGQRKEMVIHDFRTQANIDEKILKNLSRKGNLANEIRRLMKDKTELKRYVEGL
jgi:SNF2 family DNA or RNA helicase